MTGQPSLSREIHDGTLIDCLTLLQAVHAVHSNKIIHMVSPNDLVHVCQQQQAC